MSLKNFNSKSQIFLFDLILAIVIFFVSLSLFYSYYIDVDDDMNLNDLNVQILNSFTSIKINDLNDDDIRELFIEGKIKNIENTVAEQVIDFYSQNNISEAQDLSRAFVEDYVGNNMNFDLSLRNVSDDLVVCELYNKTGFSSSSFENSSIASTSQRVVFSFVNSSDYYGPYNIVVRLWK